MRIAVAGATGRIGSLTRGCLERDGHLVRDEPAHRVAEQVVRPLGLPLPDARGVLGDRLGQRRGRSLAGDEPARLEPEQRSPRREMTGEPGELLMFISGRDQAKLTFTGDDAAVSAVRGGERGL